MSEPVEPHRYIFLDGLRGIAALAVASIHAAGIVGGPPLEFENVGLAVDFFFCLSGFVVAHAYDAKLTGGMPIGLFMTKRLIRLYPMIFAGCVAGCLAHLLTTNDGLLDTVWRSLLAAALIPNLGVGEVYPFNGPMWSLFFEIAACLGYGIAVKMLPRWVILWTCVFGGLLLGAAILYAGQVVTFGVAGKIGFLNGTFRVCYPFLLGVLLQRSRISERIVRFHPIVGVSLLILILFAKVPSQFVAVYQLIAAMFLLPMVLVIGAAALPLHRGLWEVFGRISYPLYIMHWPVIIVVNHFLGANFGDPLVEVAGVVASIIAAWLALICYDQPTRAWLGVMHRLRENSRAKSLRA